MVASLDKRTHSYLLKQTARKERAPAYAALGGMETTMNLMQSVDRKLGRLFLRCCAVVAFLAAAAAAVFAAVVLLNGHLIGLVILSAGALFLWLGLIAWRDRATLAEVLNRDFERIKQGKPETRAHDTK